MIKNGVACQQRSDLGTFPDASLNASQPEFRSRHHQRFQFIDRGIASISDRADQNSKVDSRRLLLVLFQLVELSFDRLCLLLLLLSVRD